MLTYKIFIAALASQTLDRVLHPLDNLLSMQQKYSLNIRDSFKIIKEKYGIKGFYHGFLAPLLTFGPARVLMLSTYYTLKHNMFAAGVVASCILSGIIAGIVDATLTAPAENYRTRRIFNITNQIKDIKDLYNGYQALLLRSIFGATIILAGADLLMLYCTLPYYINSYFVYALITGIISQFFTSPFDIWKNAIMSDLSKSAKEHLYNIIQTRNFYSGLLTKMLRMGLGSSLVIGTMNLLLK